MKFQIERVEASRNFANKLWNASRFVIMGIDNEELSFDGTEEFNLSDKWILSRLNTVIQESTINLDKFELGVAANKIYEFVWNEYCDWYIELSKKRIYGEDKIAKATVQKVLVKVLKDILKLLHPFMPYITEEIWASVPSSKGSIVTSDWPLVNEDGIDEVSEKRMSLIMDSIKNIRNVRADMDVIPSRKAKILIVAKDEIANLLKENEEYLKALASASDVIISEKNDVSDDAVAVVIEGGELFLPLEELIDFRKEIERLEKEKEKFTLEVERVNKKLSNQGFVAKAPEKLIETEKSKKVKYEEMLEKVNERIESMISKQNLL